MSEIHFFKRSIFVTHPCRSEYKPTPPDRSHTKVDHFSKKSRRRLQFVVVNNSHKLISQFGLTYHNDWPTDGADCKKHLNRLLTYLRQNYPGINYLWIMEFQTRKAPHYHLFLDIEPDRKFQEVIAKKWNKILQEDDQHLAFHNHPTNFISWDMGSGSYLTKYLDKDHQKTVPQNYNNFGRFWGHTRALKPVPIACDLDDLEDLASIDKETGEIYGGKTQVLRWLGRYHRRATNGFSKFYIRAHHFSALMMDGIKIYNQIENYFYDKNYVDNSQGFRSWSEASPG